MAVGNVPCGIAIPQSFANVPVDVTLIKGFVSKAETLGYDSLWVQEQIISDIAILEPVTLLTYAAAVTAKLRLGTSVLVGVGIGGPHVPEATFGVSNQRRVRRFIETLEVLKAFWTQPRATFDGEFWRFENVPMEPKPVQRPHPPIWFGARTEIGLKRAARHGDGWMGAGSSSSADFVQHVELLQRFLNEVGRDPKTFRLSKRVYIAVDDNRDRAERRLREWFGLRYKNADMASRVSIWGGRAECIEKLGQLVRAGAQHLMLNPVFDEMEHLVLLAGEVVPHL